jgi:hypothetical protein
VQAENTMTEEKLQIEFLKELILNSPNKSEMNISGFYSEHISDHSFRKLFSEKQVPDKSQISTFIIPLTSELKNVLLNILELEKEKLIFDLVHFSIENERKPIFVSYDGMELMQINKTEFNAEFINLISEKYNELGIELFDKINDYGFFGTDKKAST